MDINQRNKKKLKKRTERKTKKKERLMRSAKSNNGIRVLEEGELENMTDEQYDSRVQEVMEWLVKKEGWVKPKI